MDERDIYRKLRESHLRLDDKDPATALKALECVLHMALPSRTNGQTITMKRVRKWVPKLIDRLKSVEQNPHVHREAIPRIGASAMECIKPGVKSPHALFVHILKEDFGYDGRGGFREIRKSKS